MVLEMMERTPRPPPKDQSPPPDDETSVVSISVSAGLTSVKYTPNADSSKMAALILDNLETRCSTITENASVHWSVRTEANNRGCSGVREFRSLVSNRIKLCMF